MFQLNRIDLDSAQMKDAKYQALVDMAQNTLPKEHKALAINIRKITPYFRAHLYDLLWEAEKRKTCNVNAVFDRLSSMAPMDVFWDNDRQLRSLLTLVYLKRDINLLIVFCEVLLQLLKFYNEVALKSSKTANQRIIKLLEQTFENKLPNSTFVQIQTLEKIREICQMKYTMDESFSMKGQFSRISREIKKILPTTSDSGRQSAVQI
ncbi:MAG: hypothetical protein P1V18_01200 [Candidatus Gracilibacteria bacterium]|nr:hypothetical protein [Candidatus Gracilibacteria bacterium]